jgi:predicted DNA-binding protein
MAEKEVEESEDDWLAEEATRKLIMNEEAWYSKAPDDELGREPRSEYSQ